MGLRGCCSCRLSCAPATIRRRAPRRLACLEGITARGAGLRKGTAEGWEQGAPWFQVRGAGASTHGQAPFPAVTGEHYEGGHWLGTFAVYLTSGAGFAALR